MDLTQSLSPVKPQPIPETEVEELEKTAVPHTSWRKTLVKILRSVQKYSAYSFLGFYGLHTASVIGFPGLNFPMEICQEVFEAARSLYTSVPVEAFFSGAVAAHVACGIGIRMVSPRTANKTKRINNNNLVVGDQLDQDYGLGGLTGLLGLGSRRSAVSRWTGLSPLSFSGYVLMPLLWVHKFKFKEAPIAVDGDRAGVSLQYVGVVLNRSLVRYGPYINAGLLMMLVSVSSYHIVSGMLRYTRRYSSRYKRIGYGVIGGMVMMAMVSLMRMRWFDFDSEYMERGFLKYVEYTRL